MQERNICDMKIIGFYRTSGEVRMISGNLIQINGANQFPLSSQM